MRKWLPDVHSCAPSALCFLHAGLSLCSLFTSRSPGCCALVLGSHTSHFFINGVWIEKDTMLAGAIPHWLSHLTPPTSQHETALCFLQGLTCSSQNNPAFPCTLRFHTHAAPHGTWDSLPPRSPYPGIPARLLSDAEQES